MFTRRDWQRLTITENVQRAEEAKVHGGRSRLPPWCPTVRPPRVYRRFTAGATARQPRRCLLRQTAPAPGRDIDKEKTA